METEQVAKILPLTRKELRDFIISKGVKSSHQRILILEEILNGGENVYPQDIYDDVKEQHPSISLSTVYRACEDFALAGICKIDKPHQKQSYKAIDIKDIRKEIKAYTESISNCDESIPKKNPETPAPVENISISGEMAADKDFATPTPAPKAPPAPKAK